MIGYTPTYVVYDSGAILKHEEALAKKYPELLKGVVNGSPIPIRVFFDTYQRKIDMNNARTVMQSFIEKRPKDAGATLSLDDLFDPRMQPLWKYLGQMFTHEPFRAIREVEQTSGKQNGALDRSIGIPKVQAGQLRRGC